MVIVNKKLGILITLLTSCYLSACNINTQIEKIDKNLNSRVNDFEKTEIIVGQPAEADGSSQLLMVVHLKNSDNSSVPEFRPEYTVTQGSNVIGPPCTSSDNNGVSACILKATEPGVRTLTLVNAKKGLSTQVEFIAPQKGATRLAMVSAGHINATTPAGSKLQLNMGTGIKGAGRETVGGYKIYFSLQGANP